MHQPDAVSWAALHTNIMTRRNHDRPSSRSDQKLVVLVQILQHQQDQVNSVWQWYMFPKALAGT